MKLGAPICALIAALLGVLSACGGGDDVKAAPGLGDVALRCGTTDLSTLSPRVFVSPTGSDAAGCGGSAATPCLSVQQGIAHCTGAGCGVLARWGRYDTAAAAPGLPRNVLLRNQVHVIGSCAFDGTTDPRYRSVLHGPPDMPVVLADGIALPTRFEGFNVVAATSSDAATASIAMVARAAGALQPRSLRLIGAPGVAGKPGAEVVASCAGALAAASCAGAGGSASGYPVGQFARDAPFWSGRYLPAGGAGNPGGPDPYGRVCGGGAGVGGQHGGASLGLLTIDQPLALDPSVVIYAGPGGAGGTGGTGGYGFLASGAGSGGSGGNGGVSMALVALGLAQTPQVFNEGVFANLQGAAGPAGAGGTTQDGHCVAGAGGAGLAGVAAPAYVVGSDVLAKVSTSIGPGRDGPSLASGGHIDSPSRRYRLLNRNDGRAAFFDGATVLWVSDSPIPPAADSLLVWYQNIDLCLIAPLGGIFPFTWCTGVPAEPLQMLAVEEGRIVIYDRFGNAQWQRP